MGKNPKIDIWFEDECHFQQHGSRCIMWVPPEDIDPVVLHAPTRKSVAVFGAVRNTDGYLATSLADTFDAATFLSFLKQILRHQRNGVLTVIVLDNARYHHARLLTPWLEEHQSLIRLDFLPPYSPELNPIERVWKLTRTMCTHNRYFQHLNDLIQVISNQFVAWRKPNDALYRLCAIN